jgi:hypothetical protein
VTVKFARKAGETDQLFGSVTSGDLADALKAQGFEIDKRRIALDEPIKILGESHRHREAGPRSHRGFQSDRRKGSVGRASAFSLLVCMQVPQSGRLFSPPHSFLRIFHRTRCQEFSKNYSQVHTNSTGRIYPFRVDLVPRRLNPVPAPPRDALRQVTINEARESSFQRRMT